MEFPSFAPWLAAATAPKNPPGEVIARIARQIFSPPASFDLTTVILIAAAGIITQILAYWIAAKVVVGNEHGTLARAAHLWLLSVLVGIGMGVLLVIGVMAAAASQQPVLLLVSIGGWIFLAFLLALLLPAKVFETGLLRALGILILSSILVVAGQTAIHRSLGRPAFVRWQPLQQIITASPASRERRIKHLLAGDPLGSIESELDRLSLAGERKKSFGERQEGLRAVFASLEAQRKLLKADDSTALADYAAVLQRYESLLEQMRADYAASLAPPAGAPPPVR